MADKKTITKKSFSRFFALQILFSYLSQGGGDLLELIDFLEEYYISDEFSIEDREEYRKNINVEFMRELLVNTVNNLETIDIEIATRLPEKYPMDKLDDIIKDIFRLAFYENAYMDTPRKVVLSEYVDIAGEYLDDKAVSFVNATLDNILDRKNEDL